jgi:nucleoside phosphorylase
MPRAVILTALSIEYSSVRNHLTNPQEEIHPQGTIYELGKFIANGQSWDVGIAEVGAGNAGAAVEAERAIAYFKPDILFFVGIAGGIKDVEIGDVVAATEVYGYESGKAEEQQFLSRPKAGKSSHALVQRAKAEARKGEWLQRLVNTPTLQPRVFVAPIVAGDKVVASKRSDVFNFIRANYNDAIAVEMEGFGFLSAAFAYQNVMAIVIRGISDLVNDKNDDSIEPEKDRQEKAARHASAFAFEMLSKLESVSQPHKESEEDYQKKLQQYQTEFAQIVRQKYPFSYDTRNQLKKRQKILGLKDKDVLLIEEQTIQQWQEIYQNNLQTYRQEFDRVIQEEYPLTPNIQERMEKLKQFYQFRSGDVLSIEKQIIEKYLSELDKKKIWNIFKDK